RTTPRYAVARGEVVDRLATYALHESASELLVRVRLQAFRVGLNQLELECGGAHAEHEYVHDSRSARAEGSDRQPMRQRRGRTSGGFQRLVRCRAHCREIGRAHV